MNETITQLQAEICGSCKKPTGMYISSNNAFKFGTCNICANLKTNEESDEEYGCADCQTNDVHVEERGYQYTQGFLEDGDVNILDVYNFESTGQTTVTCSHCGVEVEYQNIFS